MENKIDKIINNSLIINNKFISKDKIKLLIKHIYDALVFNKEALKIANEIDIKNKNAFKIELDVINKIFNNVNEEFLIYEEVINSERNLDKKLVYGKYLSKKGTVLLINDGNFYILLEMVLKNLIARNSLIINTCGYMFGVNNLFIELVQTILEKNNFSKNQIQIVVSETCEEILKHYSSLDLVLVIGNHNLQRFVQNHCKNELIISGYENFDIYVDTNKYLDFINKIRNQNLSIQFYLNKNLNVEIEDAILVDDVEEAVAQINFNGSRYSSAIFTDNEDNASYFMKNVKSKILTINTSPTIERICDITLNDLMTYKTVIYPCGEFSDRVNFNVDKLINNDLE